MLCLCQRFPDRGGNKIDIAKGKYNSSRIQYNIIGIERDKIFIFPIKNINLHR